MGRRARWAAIFVVGILSAQVPAWGGGYELPPQAARGLTVPVGFAATVFAQTSLVPTTLSWGPDTAAGLTSTSGDALHGTLLYVGGVSGNPISCDGCGQVVAFGDERAPVGVVAEGLNSVLGIAFGPDETMYVTDNLNTKGRVVALTDGDGDGVFENQRVLLQNIPGGRHQTNGLTMGPDGMLYVAVGNATDDGIHCGPPDNEDCPQQEVKPWTGSIIRVDPAWENVDLLEDVRVDEDPFYAEDGLDDESVLVSPGYRNIYDVDFNPRNPDEIWTAMNGSDNPSSSEPLYAIDVANEHVVGFDPETEEPILGPVIEDSGFPSCLYDPHENPFPEPTIGHDHPGIPEPQHNTDPEVREKFGDCPIETVHRPRTIFGWGHEGTSGLVFERGGNFPARYDGDLFVAEWGSIWNLNGSPPTGHKVVVFDVEPDGSVGNEREFMSGILPIDVTFGPDGFLYVADMSGQIYQVQHVTDAATADVVAVDMLDPANNGVAQFVPQVVSIVQGQTVRWVNSDDAPHNVRAVAKVRGYHDPLDGQPLPTAPGTEINSPGEVAPGGTHSYTFWEPGVWVYNSTVGADVNRMWGMVIVAPVQR